MELHLRQQTLPYLEPVSAAALMLEESAECIVPDSSPDVERVLDCGGMVLLRGKECREGSSSANGSVRAWVLYLAEGEQTPRRLELIIPFSGRLEHPSLNGETTLCARCSLRSLDTRVVNPRKLSVRAGVTAELKAWSPSQLQFSSGSEPQEGLQCRVEARRIVVPVAAGEKPFVVSDELELPAGQPPVREILRWNAVPEITDRRMVGEKAVFKGDAALELLYSTEQGTVERWQTRLPFSQYMDLPGASDEDSLCIVPMLTGAELEPDGFGSRLQLTLHLNAQCLAEAQRELTLLTDLYSLSVRAQPTMQTLQVESLLDRQQIWQDCRESMACPGGRPVAARVLLDAPTQRQEGDDLSISADAQLVLLYQDAEDQWQSLSRRVTLECRTVLAQGCVCRPELEPVGEVLCMPTAEGAELRFGLQFVLPSYANMDLSSVARCELSERQEAGRQPSLIVRSIQEGECLWSVAKACSSSIEAITAANNLDGPEPSPGMLLLIPRG